MIEKLLSIFEADLAYLRSLGDTSKQNTEYGVRLRTLEVLGGDVTKKPTLLVDVEKRILELLGGENSDYKSIYVIRKEIADKMGIDTSNLKTVYEIALACLNASPIEIEYTVTFKNYDGTILSTQKVLSGEVPVYEGSTPVRESDGEYNYTFNGWLPELGPVTGNVEYVAQYTATEIPVGPDLTLPYVTFTAEEAGSTLGLAKVGKNQTLEYSTDTTNWNTMNTSTSISLSNTGDKVYIRGILSADGGILQNTQFKMTGKIAASGNCNAIWNYQDLNAPLKKYCGYGMFDGCTSLVTAPELHAKTLKTACYREMFDGCTNLNHITCLATDISAGGLNYWVNGVSSTGTFIKDPNMTAWTTGVDGIPSGWTVEDYAG